MRWFASFEEYKRRAMNSSVFILFDSHENKNHAIIMILLNLIQGLIIIAGDPETSSGRRQTRPFTFSIFIET